MKQFFITLIVIASSLSVNAADNPRWEVPEKPMPVFSAYVNDKQNNRAGYQQAILDYLYPLIVNANIGYLRLQRTIERSRHFGPLMQSMCQQHDLVCTADNYRSKLMQSYSMIWPSELMAHMIKRTGFASHHFAVVGNNWFMVACYTDLCGYRLRGPDDTVRIREYSEVSQSVIGMMELMQQQPAMRIREERSWQIDTINSEGYLRQVELSYADYEQLIKTYRLGDYDKAFQRHLRQLPLHDEARLWVSQYEPVTEKSG